MVLKKRFCRKRTLAKKIAVSGSGRKEVADAQRDLEEYSFLGWLSPFVRQRNTQTNISTDTQSVGGDEKLDVVDDNFSYEPETFQESAEMDEKYSDTESVSSVRSRTTSKHPTEREVEAHSHRMKKHKQADVVGTEMTMMKNMSQLLEYKIERHQNSESEDRDGDDIFGKMIASELKTFPTVKCQVKHELNNVIYRFRMGGFSSPEMSPPPAPMFSLQSPPHTTPTQHSRMGNFPQGGWLNHLNN